MSRKQRVSLEPTRRSTPMSHAAFDICEIRKAMPDGGSEIVGIEDVYDALVESERIVGGFTRFRFTEEGGLAQSPNFVVEGTKPPATASSLAFQNPLCREPGTRHTNQACKLDSKLNTRITATERTKSRQLQYCGHLHSPPMAFSPSSLSPRTSLNKVEPHHNLDTAAEAVLVSRISEMVSHVHHLFSELCSFDFDQDQVNSHLSARFEDLSCRFTRSPRNHHERNGKLHKILVHLFFVQWRARSRKWARDNMSRLLQMRRHAGENLMRKAVVIWHASTVQLAVANKRVALATFARSFIQEMFKRWVTFVSRATHARSLHAAAIGRFRSTTTSRAWNTWREHMDAAHSVICAINLFKRHEKAARFRRWLERIVEISTQRKCMHKCTMFRMHGLINAAWNRWRERVNEIKLARVTVTWFRERKMIGHWLRWREFVVECKQMAYALKTKTFIHWAELSTEACATRSKILCAMKRLKSHTIKVAFERWRRFVFNARVTHELVREMGLRSCLSAMNTAWERWLCRVEHASLFKYLASKAIALFSNTLIARAWSTWKEYSMLHALAEEVLSVWVSSLMRKMFVHWRKLAHRRVIVCELMSLACVHRNKRSLMTAWDSWRHVHSATVLNTCAKWHKRRASLTACFKCWTVATTIALISAEHWRMAEDYSSRALTAITFSRWIDAMRDLLLRKVALEKQEVAAQHRVWRLSVDVLWTWRKSAKSAVAHRKSVTFATRFEQQRRLKQYVHGWHRWMTACWGGREVLARAKLRLWHRHVKEAFTEFAKMVRASNHDKIRLGRRIFMAWLHTWLVEARVRLARHIIEANSRRRAFNKWCLAQHSAAHRRRSLIYADKHHRNRTLSSYFAIFVHIWAKRMLLRAFSYRRLRRKVLVVFRSWAELTYESKVEHWAKRSANFSYMHSITTSDTHWMPTGVVRYSPKVLM